MRTALMVVLATLLSVPVHPQPSDAGIDVPAEVERLVPEGHTAIDVESGDLNRDGREDYLVVLQRIAPEAGA